MVADGVAARGEEPTKYWVSTLPPTTKLKALIKMAKHRWIIERDYEELKQELGLGHFEGRNWLGFHHHATLCIAAYGSWWPSGTVFPLCPRRSSWIRCPQASAGLPTRGSPRPPERHNPHSIATLRIVLARLLLRQLPDCPFCGLSPG